MHRGLSHPKTIQICTLTGAAPCGVRSFCNAVDAVRLCMMKTIAPVIALLTLGACGPDETISGYTKPDAVYHLVTLDGAAFSARATIQFPQEGAVIGHGPCNSYSATQNTYYPWFELGPIAATRTACPDLGGETEFFTALDAMLFSEVSGDVLLLTGEAGREMTFEAR